MLLPGALDDALGVAVGGRRDGHAAGLAQHAGQKVCGLKLRRPVLLAGQGFERGAVVAVQDWA